MMFISKHFSQAEAEKSQTALRLGIDNSLPETLLPSVRNVAESLLEPIREFYGVPFTPSSWYRCTALCKAIGSKTTSQHARGEAVDIEVPGITNFQLAEHIIKNLKFDQLILEHYVDGEPHSGWVHVSLKLTGDNRGEVLRYDGQHYRQGLFA